jgi:hypothetical protein
VKGFILLQRGALAVMRDEDYATAQRLIYEGLPLGSPSDFRMSFGSFALAVLASGLHDFRLLRPYISSFSVAAGFRDVFFRPMLLACRIVQLADQKEYRHAAVLLYSLPSFALHFADQSFPMGWSYRWGLFTRLRAQLEAELSADGYKAAKERGAQFTEADIDAETQAMLAEIMR